MSPKCQNYNAHLHKCFHNCLQVLLAVCLCGRVDSKATVGPPHCWMTGKRVAVTRPRHVSERVQCCCQNATSATPKCNSNKKNNNKILQQPEEQKILQQLRKDNNKISKTTNTYYMIDHLQE